MQVENTVTIERPIEEVFEYVSTPENDPTWVSASIRTQRTSPGPMRVGMTTEEDVKFLGRTSRDTWEVTEYEPPTIVAYRASSGLLSGAVVRVRCEPIEGGTRLTHAVEYEPRGIYYKALAPLMPWVLPRLLDSMDRTLKNLLEGEPTTSQPRPESTSGTITAGVVAAMVVAVIALVLLLRRRSRSSRR
ncbi:MAG: SRPBCC family protein [Actinomycetota bacterium]|nr:SRPBCC family protein [Actinomycetota bacterium]